MAFVNLTAKTWGSAPAITMTPSYEMQRSGANMQYRIKMTVSTLTGTSYFGYPIYMKTSLDGTLKDTATLKKASPSQWSSAITYTTGWLTVSNKTSGTTSLSLNIYSGSGNSRNSTYTYSLPVEPAASVLGTVSNFTIGNGINIPITKYSSTFTDTLTVSLGTTTIKTVSGVTNGYDVSFTTAELNTIYSKLPASTTGTFTFKITTKNGSTTVGTSTKTATGTVGSAIKPSISSVTISEANTDIVPSSWGIYVKNKSRARVVTSAIAGNGSSISSVKTVLNGRTYTGTDIISSRLNVSGSLTATITVTDRRGRTVSTTRTISVSDYENPYITNLEATRCDVDGNVSDSGTYAKVSLKGGIYSLGGNNTPFSYVIKYKKTTESEYLTYTFDVSDTSIDSYVILSDIDENSSYNVVAEITDYFTSTLKNLTPELSSAFTTVDYLDGGKGMALGKVAEDEGIFDVGFKSRFVGGIDPVFLDAETDLNDVKNCGWYTGENITNYNYINCPLTSGTFALEVTSCGKNGQLKQSFSHCNKEVPITFERFYYEGSWGEWIRTDDFNSKLLWEGTYYMNAGQTITLVESILSQPTGAVLIFSKYDTENKVASNTEFTCHFVPKRAISLHGGYGFSFNLCTPFSNGNKYLYIGATTIRGHANNEGTLTIGGITYTNSEFVLRYVMGV